MAENEQPQNPLNETLLIAHVTVQLVEGSTFELYPFIDEKDVKSRVAELAEGWAKSGFLLRGNRLIPWSQVRLLEATSVEEITRQEAHQRLLTWQAEDQRQAVHGFWKTKEEAPKKEHESSQGAEAHA